MNDGFVDELAAIAVTVLGLRPLQTSWTRELDEKVDFVVSVVVVVATNFVGGAEDENRGDISAAGAPPLEDVEVK